MSRLHGQFWRKAAVITSAVLLLGGTPLVTGSAAGADSGLKVVDIVGKDSFQPNIYLLNTYHFDRGVIRVHRGERVLFRNKTTDGHTITLVANSDLPRNIPDLFRCRLCAAVNKVYFPRGGHNPAGVQIDNGMLTDDQNPDADTPDPAVPPGPVLAYIEDFDAASHSNPDGSFTVGDSTLIGPVGSPAPSSRTIVITAAPGSVLHYYCTLHPWMQATILVS